MKNITECREKNVSRDNSRANVPMKRRSWKRRKNDGENSLSSFLPPTYHHHFAINSTLLKIWWRRKEIRSFVKAFPPRDLPLSRCQIFQLGVVTIHTWDRLEPLARHEYFWHRIHQYLSAVRAARFAINHIKSIRSNPEWRLATSIVLLLPGFARAGLEKESRARLSRNSRPTTCNKYPRIRRNIIEKNSPIARRNPMTICYVRSEKIANIQKILQGNDLKNWMIRLNIGEAI